MKTCILREPNPVQRQLRRSTRRPDPPAAQTPTSMADVSLWDAQPRAAPPAPSLTLESFLPPATAGSIPGAPP